MDDATRRDPHSGMRYVVLAFFALLACALCALAIGRWGARDYLYGWNVAPNGTRLMYVAPGGPAAEAGLRADDRLDWAQLSILGRANLGLVQTVAPGSRLRVRVQRDGVWRTVILTPKPTPALYAFGGHAELFARALLMITGIILVYMRPSRMTWGFLVSSLAVAPPSAVLHWAQLAPWRFLAVNGLSAVASGLAAAGILIFISRFPADTPRGPLQRLDRSALSIGAAVAALRVFIVITMLFSPLPPPRWTMLVSEYLIEVVLIVVAIVALLIAYRLTSGSDRQRIVPVLAAFTFYVAVQMTKYIDTALSTSTIELQVLVAVSPITIVALTLAVAHGVLRHRVFDVSFVVSRTVVYTVLTSIIVGAFVGIDFISSKLIEHLQVAAFFEAVSALALGVWLNVLHARIDRFVDRVLFRRRHLAEARLERTAKSLMHAEATDFIDEAVVVEPCDALALASAAVFRLRDEDSTYVRVFAKGWQEGAAAQLSADDHLVVHLRAELQPVNLTEIRWPRADVPAGMGQPLLAVPFVVRHEVLGFALYAGHSGGEAIDPDEQATLARLGEAAAAAYEYLRAKDLLDESAALRAENEVLVHEQALLREMVDALRGAPRVVQS